MNITNFRATFRAGRTLTTRIARYALGLAVIASCVQTPSFALNTGDVPSNLLPPGGWADDAWTDPGGWEVVDVTEHGLTPNTPSINASAKVSQIVSNGSGYRILYFPEGDYWFSSNLTINKNGIRLKGAGADKTKFYQQNADFTFGSKSAANTIIRLDDPAPQRGATKLYSSDANTLQPGDFILPVAQFPWGGQKDDYRAKMANLGIGQIVRVSSVSGNEVRFDDALGLDYRPWLKRRIRVLNMIKDVGIESVHIEKLSNDDKRTLFFTGVRNSFVRNCRLYYTSKQAIETKYSYRFFADSNNIQQSHDKGPGGHGYGIRYMDNSTRCYATNNKLQQLRHGIVMQTGANHCVIAYNHAQSNLLLHGNYAHNNLFEGNDAAAGINFDSVHGPNGPYNFVYRNLSIHASKGIGKLSGADPNVVIGNVTDNFDVESTDFVGANRVSGNVQWGSLSSSSSLPASLYLASKPAFLGNASWAPFGPGTSGDWGLNNQIPAKLRSITSVPEFDDMPTPDPDPEPENQAPSCTITSPSNNASYDAPASLIVTVDADDSDGSITKVELFVNGSWHSTDDTAGYSFNLSNLSAGSYTLRARAYDNDGAQKDSATISIDVAEEIDIPIGNESPVVAFEAPTDQEVIAIGTDLYVKVNASDPDGNIKNVKLFLDGALVRQEGQAPYEWGKSSQPDTVLAGLVAGSYQLEAIAQDNENATTSVVISITVGEVDEDDGIDLDLVYQAEAFDEALQDNGQDAVGVYDIGSGPEQKIGNIQSGDWVCYYGFNFGSGADSVDLSMSSNNSGGTVEFRLDSATGELIGSASVGGTGGWNNFVPVSADLTAIPLDIHDLYFVFTGGDGSLVDIDWFQFNAGTGGGVIIEPVDYQAEDATLSAGNIAKGPGSGWNGSGFVDMVEGGWIEWTVNVPVSGAYILDFNGAGNADGMACEVKVNGSVVNSSLGFANVGSWNSNWQVVTESGVSLNAGDNTIRITDAGNNQPQVDQLTVR